MTIADFFTTMDRPAAAPAPELPPAVVAGFFQGLDRIARKERELQKKRAYMKTYSPGYYQRNKYRLRAKAHEKWVREHPPVPPLTEVCVILMEHEEVLKHDPERLSTDFIRGLLKITQSCPGARR